MIQSVDRWWETSVETEDLQYARRTTDCKNNNSHLWFDKGGEREIIEEIGEILPNVGVAIFAKTFVVETVHLPGNQKVDHVEQNYKNEQNVKQDVKTNVIWRDSWFPRRIVTRSL